MPLLCPGSSSSEEVSETVSLPGVAGSDLAVLKLSSADRAVCGESVAVSEGVSEGVIEGERAGGVRISGC